MQRTDWAEKVVESLSSISLTAECVYHSPRYMDGVKEKEVCDHLIILKGKAILLSMKAQKDPYSRNNEKQHQWTVKNSMKAYEQAKGALKTIANKPFWCQHSRRGRIAFNPGEIKVTNIVVLTELFNNVVELTTNSPLTLNNIPVTYLSLNDFLNLIYELRTFPDISTYFMARRNLPTKSQLMVGNEYSNCKLYLLNSESFRKWNNNLFEAKYSNEQDMKWQDIQKARSMKQKNVTLIEMLSDSLAIRNENFSERLESHLLVRFDESNGRKNYLLMQEELCDLTFNEKAALGEQFNIVIEKIKGEKRSESMAYAAFYADSKLDLVYVLISSKGIDRNSLIQRSSELIDSAMKTYKKNKGLVIADYEGKSFEVQLKESTKTITEKEKINTSYFEHLKISHIEV